MDFETYRKNFFIDPPPPQRYSFSGLLGVTLYFQDYNPAVSFYTAVLGEPGYVEGKSTKGWRVGETWLTLLRGQQGNPQNIEVQLVLESPAEAERLQAAFIQAGGHGQPPSDQLMYAPIRSCPVTDPWGTHLLIYSPLPGEGMASP